GLDVEERGLIDLARVTAGRAYAPYSGIRVGAALEAEDGRVFTGCNVENASYGLTVCAERAAVFAAVASGARAFRRMAIYSSAREVLYPCGACLQVMSEFCRELDIILAGGEKGPLRLKLTSLLPHPTRLP
ncbi:MAG: cytidine deaminase, partial [Candidatus Geothermincolales bacterium]